MAIRRTRRTRRPTGGTPEPAKPTPTSTSNVQRESRVVRAAKRAAETGGTVRVGNNVVSTSTPSTPPTPTSVPQTDDVTRTRRPTGGTPTPVRQQPSQTVVEQPIVQDDAMPEQIQETPAEAGAGATIGLREIAEGQNLNVGYDEATGEVSIGGVPVDTSKLQLQDGSFVGTEEEVNNLINLSKLGISKDNPSPEGVQGVRDFFRSRNMEVGYNPDTKQVTVNGVPIDTSNMGLLDGRYYAREEDLQRIANNIQQQQQGDLVQGMQEGELTGEQQLQQSEQGLFETVQENALLKEQGLDQYFNQVKDLTNNMIEFKTEMMNAFNDYKPVYREEAMKILRNAYGNPFKYDPNRDPALTQAMKVAEQRVMNAMNSRGLLSSTITRDNMAEALGNMIPQYEQIAYNRYLTEKQNQLKFADKLMQIDEQDYERLKENINFNLETMQSITTDNLNLAKETLTVYNDKLRAKEEAALQEVKNKENQLKRANDLWDKYGFVTNEISSILGLPVNTPTADVYKKILTEQGLNDRKKADILEKQRAREENFLNDVALIDYKEEIAKINQAEEDAKTAIAGSILAQLMDMPIDDAIATYNLEYPSLVTQYPNATQQIDAIRDFLVQQKKQEEIERNKQQQINLGYARISESRKGREQEERLFSTSQMISTLKDLKSEFAKDLPGGGKDYSDANVNNPEYLERVVNQIDGFGVDEQTEEQLAQAILGISLSEAQAENLLNQRDIQQEYKDISEKNINPFEKQRQIDELTRRIFEEADSLGDVETANIIKERVDNPNFAQDNKEKGYRQKYQPSKPISEEQYGKIEALKQEKLSEDRIDEKPKSVFGEVTGGD